MDGLVSTGKKFPYTILKIIFSNKKIFDHFFINILLRLVDKDERLFDRIFHFFVIDFLFLIRVKILIIFWSSQTLMNSEFYSVHKFKYHGHKIFSFEIGDRIVMLKCILFQKTHLKIFFIFF